MYCDQTADQSKFHSLMSLVKISVEGWNFHCTGKARRIYGLRFENENTFSKISRPIVCLSAMCCYIYKCGNFFAAKKALQNLINPQALEQIHKNGRNSPTRKFGKSFTAPIKSRHSGIKNNILNTFYHQFCSAIFESLKVEKARSQTTLTKQGR